eukprot:6709536-Prymnesium_polylepis.1
MWWCVRVAVRPCSGASVSAASVYIPGGALLYWARRLHGLEKVITIGGEKMPMMFKAAGELTTRAHKAGGGISYEHEIRKLDKYKQLRMGLMTPAADGSLVIKSIPKADGSVGTVTLDKDDFV